MADAAGDALLVRRQLGGRAAVPGAEKPDQLVAAAQRDNQRVAEIVPAAQPAADRIVEVPAGTVLTKAGESGDSFFFIIDGRVSVETQAGYGDPLQPGDFFGEMSLLDGEPRSATITAMTDVRLLVVDRSHFWRLLNETPDLVRRMLAVLSRRVRRLEQVTYALRHRMNQT